MSLCFVPDYLRPENNGWTAADGSMMIFCILTVIVLLVGFGVWRHYLKRDKRRTLDVSWFGITFPRANFNIFAGFDRTKGVHQKALDVLHKAAKYGLPANITSYAIFYEDYDAENRVRQANGDRTLLYTMYMEELEKMGYPSTNTQEAHIDVQNRLKQL